MTTTEVDGYSFVIYHKDYPRFLARSEEARLCCHPYHGESTCIPFFMRPNAPKRCNGKGKACIRMLQRGNCLGQDQWIMCYYCKDHLNEHLRREFKAGTVNILYKDGEQTRILEEVINENKEEENNAETDDEIDNDTR